MKERFLANDSSYTHIPKKYHKQLICNISCIFCVTTLQIESTSATQSVVGVALLRHSRLPRRHALCNLHTIHLSENIANLVTLVLPGFPLPYTKKRIDERYAVGRRRRSAPPLPAAAPTCTMQPPHYSSFRKHCESCNIGTHGLSVTIS